MRVRIYYDRTSNAPLIWSGDHGSQETEVQYSGWQLHDVEARSGQDFNIPSGDTERPRVWIEIPDAAHAEVVDNILHVYGK